MENRLKIKNLDEYTFIQFINKELLYFFEALKVTRREKLIFDELEKVFFDLKNSLPKLLPNLPKVSRRIFDQIINVSQVSKTSIDKTSISSQVPKKLIDQILNQRNDELRSQAIDFFDLRFDKLKKRIIQIYKDRISLININNFCIKEILKLKSWFENEQRFDQSKLESKKMVISEVLVKHQQSRLGLISLRIDLKKAELALFKILNILQSSIEEKKELKKAIELKNAIESSLMKEDFTEEEILKLTITQFLKISISSQVPKKLVDQLVDQILDQRNDELKSQIIQDQKKKDAIQLQETVINNLFDKLKNYEVIKEESIILQQEELRRFMYEDLNEAINEYILTYKETNKCKKIVESFKFNLDDYFKTKARRPNDIWNNLSKENYLKSEKTFEQEKKKDFGTVDKNGKKSPITKIGEDLNLLFMIICLISLLIRKLHLPDKLKKIIGEKSPNKKSNKTPK